MDVIPVSTRLDDLITQFDELSIRLRLVLTVCVVAVISMVFDIFLFSANSQNIKNLQQKNLNSKNQIAELVSLQNDFNKKTFTTRSDPKTKQLARINADLAKIHSRLAEHTTNLIHPKDMPKVLKTIISSTKKLQLQSLLKKKTVDLSETNSSANSLSTNERQKNNDKNPNSEQVKLYRHSVEILLYGDYPSTLSFLKKLENMEQKIIFDSLEYVVENYPKANIKLTISTLSLNSRWIGG